MRDIRIGVKHINKKRDIKEGKKKALKTDIAPNGNRLFLSAQRIFFRIDHMLSQKTSLEKCKKI